MHNALFEAALGVQKPWSVSAVDFDQKAKRLTIDIDFPAGTRFEVADEDGQHGVHDTQMKRYRHLNFFEHECFLQVRVPRVKLPDGRVALVDPPWAGQLRGFTLLFEALVLALCQQMPFEAVARLTGISWHRVRAIAQRYVDLAVEAADRSAVLRLAIDETSSRRGHNYVTVAVDTEHRQVVSVAEGKDAAAVAAIAAELAAGDCPAERIESVTIDMSPAFIGATRQQFPNARTTFDKFHVVMHATEALDQTRRLEARTDPSLKGMRWKLLKDCDRLGVADREDLDELLRHTATKRTARAWLYRERLREILNRKQINVVRETLAQWCTNVLRSKVVPMHRVARMIREHFEGIVAWAQTRETNGYLEALNGLFQAAKRKARGYKRFDTIRTVIFLIAGKLDFRHLNPHVA